MVQGRRGYPAGTRVSPFKGGRAVRYRSPFDSKRERYKGPTMIGKPITMPVIEAGPNWIGQRIPMRSMTDHH